MTDPNRRPGYSLGQWIRVNRWPLYFSLLAFLMIPLRGFWSPDEPDFAQAVKEMIQRKSWVFPYLNDVVYTEKPILFYWAMKIPTLIVNSIMGTEELRPWVLRLPSVLSASVFLFAFHKWVRRLFSLEIAFLSVAILSTFPLWVWQSQAIQIDMLFATLVASSWMSFLTGYLLLIGYIPSEQTETPTKHFYYATLWLGLATLAKGPLGLFLSGLIGLVFFFREKNFAAVRLIPWTSMVILFAIINLPWYLAAIYQGGLEYAYKLIVYQNLIRALKAWDHIQPWWKYAEYLIGDLFPWSLGLLGLLLFNIKIRNQANSIKSFAQTIVAVSILALSLSQSKQGKYLLMIYPFLSLLFAVWISRRASESFNPWTFLKSSSWMVLGSIILGLVFLMMYPLINNRSDLLYLLSSPLIVSLVIVLPVLWTLTLISITIRMLRSEFIQAYREFAFGLSLVYILIALLGFRFIEPIKSFKTWGMAVSPIIQGHPTFFWKTIRSGAMLYTNSFMPELHTSGELMSLPLGTFVVSMKSDWIADPVAGVTPQIQGSFNEILSMASGSDTLLLMRKSR